MSITSPALELVSPATVEILRQITLNDVSLVVPLETREFESDVLIRVGTECFLRTDNEGAKGFQADGMLVPVLRYRKINSSGALAPLMSHLHISKATAKKLIGLADHDDAEPSGDDAATRLHYLQGICAQVFDYHDQPAIPSALLASFNTWLGKLVLEERLNPTLGEAVEGLDLLQELREIGANTGHSDPTHKIATLLGVSIVAILNPESRDHCFARITNLAHDLLSY